MASDLADRPAPAIRRARSGELVAELDLDKNAVTIRWERPGAADVLVGEGRWEPLPEPMGNLRGRIHADGVDRRTRIVFEYLLGRGNPEWTYERGPWVQAEQDALAAGVGDYESETLRKLVWLFYRNRWPLQFAEGCGWGPGGHAPLIAAVVADPERTRARWELLILTGALQWPMVDGALDAMNGDEVGADFYAPP